MSCETCEVVEFKNGGRPYFYDRFWGEEIHLRMVWYWKGQWFKLLNFFDFSVVYIIDESDYLCVSYILTYILLKSSFSLIMKIGVGT